MTSAGNIVLQALVLVAIFLYCRIIYSFRGQAAVCLKSVALPFSLTSKKQDRGDGEGGVGRGDGIENKRLYDRYTASAAAIGAFSIGIAAGKATAVTVEAGFAARNIVVSAEWLPVIALLGAGVTAVIVVLLEMSVLKATGRLTLTNALTDTVVGLKRTYIAAMALMVSPLVFMYTGDNPVRDEIFVYIAAGVLIAIAATYAVHTLRLFIKQKVSLLVWFLYLCTVEIFPVSLVVLLVVKNV